ncbi:FG-GAP repeat domain-containing protein [Streptomyces purpureus]|uniref:FG-GAP repeat domain-containing protein n=1 Tax=Streptomyces purpureus TaxID=1951 RepID=UPI0003A81280|nr:VCBS repeat-containing protein [Streptomyces purpureus]
MREEGEDRVSRQANPHDCNDNGSTDVLARDASGALWRDDLFDWPSGSQITTAKRTKIGTGWQVYSQIEAAGNLAGTPAGDLVARDTAGVLWLYQGTGTGTFTSRVKIGTGWSGFTHLVGAGDATGDGRPDLIAYGPNGTSVYRLTGTTTAPLTRQTAPPHPADDHPVRGRRKQVQHRRPEAGAPSHPCRGPPPTHLLQDRQSRAGPRRVPDPQEMRANLSSGVARNRPADNG